jgi:hypothetical protein
MLVMQSRDSTQPLLLLAIILISFAMPICSLAQASKGQGQQGGLQSPTQSALGAPPDSAFTAADPLLVFFIGRQEYFDVYTHPKADDLLPLVTIDGEKIARLHSGQFFSLRVAPGKHMVDSTSRLTAINAKTGETIREHKPLQIDAKPGEVVYVDPSDVKLGVTGADAAIRTIQGLMLAPLHGRSLQIAGGLGEEIGWIINPLRAPAVIAMGREGSYAITSETSKEITSLTLACLKLSTERNHLLFQWVVGGKLAPHSTIYSPSWHDHADKYRECVKEKKGQMTVIKVDFADGTSAMATQWWCPKHLQKGSNDCRGVAIDVEKIPGSFPAFLAFPPGKEGLK